MQTEEPMKNIIILAVVAVVVYFGFINSTNKNFMFNGEEYNITRTEGKNGFYKYHYTTSGRDTGSNDFIEILKFEKPGVDSNQARKTASIIQKSYNTDYVAGTQGQFGVFGPNKDKFAYTIDSETGKAYWFINYVLQSRSIDYKKAKTSSVSNINNLETLLSDLSN